MRVDISEDRPRLELELPDGLVVWVSPLTLDDRHVVEEGFDELSQESKFSRFGLGLGHLTASELDYLTDVDQRDHVAWGVSSVESEGMGVGRYIITGGSPCAEIALTVMDEWQGKGVGTLLLRVLGAIAKADGVDEFCFRFVPGNEQVRKMLQGIEVQFDETDGLMEGRMPVSVIPDSDWDHTAVELLAQFRD